MSRARPGGGEEGGGLGRNRISVPQLPHCFFSYQLETGDDTLGAAQLHELGLPTFQDEQVQQQQLQKQQQLEGSDRSLVGYEEDERRVRGRVEGWGSGQGPGVRVGVRSSRPSAGKDRHSKVNTSKGPRDRRVRLSVPTAMQFYDVQDRLGYDQPSKAVEWLIRKAKGAIDELEHLPNHPPPPSAPPAPPALAPPAQSASVPAPAASPPRHSPSSDPAASAASAAAATVDVRTESRVKARERARERAREKEARDRDRDREQRSASASASASDSRGHQSQATSDCGAAFPYDLPYNSSGTPLMAPVVRMRQLSGGPLGGVSTVLPSTFCSSTLGPYANQEEQLLQQQQQVVEGSALARPSVAASSSASAGHGGAHCLWECSMPCLDAHPTRPLHEPPFCSSLGPLQSTPVPHASYVPATLFAPSRGGRLQLQPQPLPHFHQDGSKPPRHA